MIPYRPRDAITDQLGMYSATSTQAWFLVYEAWARSLCRWERRRDTPNVPMRFCHTTLWCHDDAQRRLAELFVHAGDDEPEGVFLRSCGIKAWAGLDRTMKGPGRQPNKFAAFAWFGDCVKGRELKRPGPNECHPDALSIQCGGLRFVRDLGRWEYLLNYSYPHDASSWMFTVMQNRREGREHFAQRVNAWMGEYLVEEDFSDQHRRQCYEARWRRTAAGCRDVFSYDCGVDRERLVDELTASDHTHGIPLTPRRAKTLLGWAKKKVRSP